MQGYLRKMRTRFAEPVQYELLLSDSVIPLNAIVGKTIVLDYTGRIACVHCGRATKKSFNQGYCYPCFSSLARCDMCLLKPETCHFEKGTCREPDWGRTFCMQPHTVYLANSSGIKVGITRQNQLPTRWIDQGAVQALPIFNAQTRHISGLIEVVFAKRTGDKTHWQQMLKNHVQHIDLIAKRDELTAACNIELTAITDRFGLGAFEFLRDEQVLAINYPVRRYPDKVKSFNLDTDAQVSGLLEGIKGQYLILHNGVINLRKYAGYELEFSVID